MKTIDALDLIKRENELCDKVERLCNNIRLLETEGKNTAQLYEQLEATLEELCSHKQKLRQISKGL